MRILVYYLAIILSVSANENTTDVSTSEKILSKVEEILRLFTLKFTHGGKDAAGTYDQCCSIEECCCCHDETLPKDAADPTVIYDDWPTSTYEEANSAAHIASSDVPPEPTPLMDPLDFFRLPKASSAPHSASSDVPPEPTPFMDPLDFFRLAEASSAPHSASSDAPPEPTPFMDPLDVFRLNPLTETEVAPAVITATDATEDFSTSSSTLSDFEPNYPATLEPTAHVMPPKKCCKSCKNCCKSCKNGAKGKKGAKGKNGAKGDPKGKTESHPPKQPPVHPDFSAKKNETKESQLLSSAKKTQGIWKVIFATLAMFIF